MSNELGINWNQVDDLKDFDPIAEGNYTAIVSEAKIENKYGNLFGVMKIKIVVGAMKDKVINEWFTINHTNDTAMKIGRGRMKQLKDACGLNDPKNINEFLNIPFDIAVTVTKEEKDGRTFYNNNIKKFERRGALTKAVAKGVISDSQLSAALVVPDGNNPESSSPAGAGSDWPV